MVFGSKKSVSINIDLDRDFTLKTLFSGDFGIKDLDVLETLQVNNLGRVRLVSILTYIFLSFTYLFTFELRWEKVKSLKEKKFYTLKILKKGKVVKLQQLEHVQNEVI